MVGLPEGVRACLFDLDGVLTQTAKVLGYRDVDSHVVEQQDTAVDRTVLRIDLVERSPT